MQVIDELTIYAVDCVDPQQLSLINPVQSTHHLRSHVVSCTGRVIKVMMFFLHGPLFFVFVTRMMPYRPIIHRHLVPGLFRCMSWMPPWFMQCPAQQTTITVAAAPWLIMVFLPFTAMLISSFWPFLLLFDAMAEHAEDILYCQVSCSKPS